MFEYNTTMEVSVRIVANDAGNAAIERYVGLSPEAAREWYVTPDMSKDEVIAGLVKAAIYTGIEDASRLDGWADLEHGDIYIYIDDVDVLW